MLQNVIDQEFDGVQARFAEFLGVRPQSLTTFLRQGYLPKEQARKVHARFPRYRVRDLVDPDLVAELCE